MLVSLLLLLTTMNHLNVVPGFCYEKGSFIMLYWNNPDLALSKAVEAMERYRKARREKKRRDAKYLTIDKKSRNHVRKGGRSRRGFAKKGEKTMDKICSLLSKMSIEKENSGTVAEQEFSNMMWERSLDDSVSQLGKMVSSSNI